MWCRSLECTRTNWYESKRKIKKSEELKQLCKQIAWRSKEIRTKNIELSELYQQGLEQEGKIEHLQFQQRLLKEGFHNLVIEKDPRLVNIHKAIQHLGR